ncbi:hypothetical protein HMI01_20390 [Halolactibacillus miurensis]|uniref:Uncharacterized protein n=1 Tax=Halolactibacillus miurensis TaxID=306541 RepID=A0A1I6U9P6_9BACI|nr:MULTISPECIES: hypothetical protein [Halolactibacillus]GEM05051.1 hypothetical protein HMI01_20390 [Halolactibacillus miurensis]SFS98124.1 hypothetical protein SAMN05421668_12340 [Halolactibacillus miurensis]
MKVFSIISMVIFTLTIWGAFGVIYVTQQTPTYNFREVEALVVPEYTEYAASMKRFEMIEQAVTDESTNDVTNEETTNETADNIYQQASSPTNDILYSFEKDQPVSVDQLLIALGISE